MKTLHKCVASATISAALTGAALVSAPSTLHSEVLNLPETSMASILEINRDYLKVMGYSVYADPDNPSFMDRVHFDVTNPQHMNQVYDLGDFGCALYDRHAVYLSHMSDPNVAGTVFLFACALP